MDDARTPAPAAAAAELAADATGVGALSPDAAARRAARDRHLAECLHRVARGDAAAFEAFYDATFGHARGMARRYLGDDECEDLLAEVFFEVWRVAPRYDPARGSPVTWLLVMVRSRALDLLRQRISHPSVGGSQGEPEGEFGAEAEPGAGAEALSAQDPADLLWREQRDQRLHAALQGLSAAERWVLGLAYFRELSHAQVAAATGMPLGTVKSLIFRAQAQLRQTLAGAQG